MKKFSKLFGLLLAMMLTFILVACGSAPGKLTEGVSKMKDAGYEVTEMDSDDVADLFGSIFDLGAKTAMSCEKESTNDVLIVIWFETSENAKDFKVLLKLSDAYLNEALNYGKDEDEKMVMQYDAKGEVAYYGTEQAVKDFLA